jgi:hypothetical protein
MALILATKLKNQFSKNHVFNLKNTVVNNQKRGCSGFITKQNVTVYINTEINDYLESSKNIKYLIRTAKNDKDYTGGVNQFARDFDELIIMINTLLDFKSD